MSCGVSMPTRKRRAADVREGGRQPLREPVAALRHDRPAARQPRARAAVEHERRAGARRSRRTRPACPPARRAASRAACAGVHGGHSRVLTRPATGALRDHEQRGASRAAPPPCRGPRGTCRAPCRSPSSVRRAGGSATPTSSIRQPAAAGAQHHLERPAEAAVAHAQREQGLASAPPASARGRAAGRRCGRRSSAASSALAAPRVQRPRSASAGGAEHEVALARGDRPGDPRQLRGVERGVAVHEADDAGPRGGQPRPAGGAEPALRLVDHARRRDGPRGRPDPSVEPLSTTIGS